MYSQYDMHNAYIAGICTGTKSFHDNRKVLPYEAWEKITYWNRLSQKEFDSLNISSRNTSMEYIGCLTWYLWEQVQIFFYGNYYFVSVWRETWEETELLDSFYIIND